MELIILKDKMFATLDDGVEVVGTGERVDKILYMDTADITISKVKEDLGRREIRKILKKLEIHTAWTDAELKFTYSKKAKVVVD